MMVEYERDGVLSYVRRSVGSPMVGPQIRSVTLFAEDFEDIPKLLEFLPTSVATRFPPKRSEVQKCTYCHDELMDATDATSITNSE